jgi:hypothetical protein
LRGHTRHGRGSSRPLTCTFLSCAATRT